VTGKSKLARKILVTGTTTSGKTTILEAVTELEWPGVVVVREAATDVLRQQPGIEKTAEFQDVLFAEQVKREREAMATAEVDTVLCDRGVLDNLAHILMFSAWAGTEAEFKPEWLSWCVMYDEVWLLDKDDIDYREPTELQASIDSQRDWAFFRDELDEYLRVVIGELRLPWVMIQGTVEERLRQVDGGAGAIDFLLVL
jgi:predicted ATPase